jgi:hypothetical protein
MFSVGTPINSIDTGYARIEVVMPFVRAVLSALLPASHHGGPIFPSIVTCMMSGLALNL